MVKIRLARQGSGHNKFFRIIVIDEKQKRSGQALDTVGFWQPSKNLEKVDFKKIQNWVDKGAILSNAVSELVKRNQVKTS